MRRHIAYLKYVLKHKWFVFVECLKFGIPFQGIVHDWHKFLPSEWFPYANHFYDKNGVPWQVRDKTGYYKPTDTGDPAFDYAWFLHQKRGKHHWQYWAIPTEDGSTKALPIPMKYIIEMVADWEGASRAQGASSVAEWYGVNRHKLQLHPETREWIELIAILHA